MLTVGGLLHVSVALPSVPTDIRMTAVTVRIIQYFDIRLPSDRERSISAPFQVVDVLTLNGGSPREHPLSGPVTEPDVIFTAAAKPDDPALLAVIPAGQSLELACFTRVPTTRRIRPTTIQQGTSMPIRISHEIRFEIQYRTPTSKERVARLSQPISFISVRPPVPAGRKLTGVLSARSARACCSRATARQPTVAAAPRTTRMWSERCIDASASVARQTSSRTTAASPRSLQGLQQR